ncbi:hypothetical protein [Kaistella palustris]|uniref:hypothetical protein n=1 Tax=Kaistella palustris TaxID=493376 RepID=UPI00040F69F3|nr:hypothetical protein [Kaistella palustris]
MKKLFTILLVTGLISATYAQEGNVFTRSYNAKNQQAVTAEDDPGGDGDNGGGDAAPIDDYLPLLAIAGVGMAVYFSRKKFAAQV